MLQYDFTGRVAVVTGGRWQWRAASSRPAARWLIDVKPEPEDLGRFGDRALYAQGDLTDETFVRRTIDAAAERFGLKPALGRNTIYSLEPNPIPFVRPLAMPSFPFSKQGVIFASKTFAICKISVCPLSGVKRT